MKMGEIDGCVFILFVVVFETLPGFVLEIVAIGFVVLGIEKTVVFPIKIDSLVVGSFTVVIEKVVSSFLVVIVVWFVKVIVDGKFEILVSLEFELLDDSSLLVVVVE
jgi:hypothetical protein